MGVDTTIHTSDNNSVDSLVDMSESEDIEVGYLESSTEGKPDPTGDISKQRFVCVVPMMPLVLRDDEGRPLRRSIRKHRQVALILLFVIIVVIVALVSILFTKPGAPSISNDASTPQDRPNNPSNERSITLYDLENICVKGATTFSTDSISEDILNRQSEFAALISDAGAGGDLSPTSCSPENLAVLYLAANPPLNLDKRRLFTRFALITFFISMHGWKWKDRDNWLDTQDECNWFGIMCTDSGILTGITLHHNNLGGTLPEMFSHLSTLTVLNVAQNSIAGTLPSSIEKLTSLSTLELSLNSFSGTIPATLWKLSHLEIINLLRYGGSVTSIPTEIGNFSNLQRLLISGTKASGQIPVEIGSCQSLRLLDLSFNTLQSPIPTQLGSLSKLQSLFLAGNQFNSDDMPPQICSRFTSSQGTLLAFDMKGRCPLEE